MHIVNAGIFAHIDAGKTTLTEQLLFQAGATHRAGSVDGGTSTTDFLPVERARGISVRNATVTLRHRDMLLHIIDTPGHADFAEEAELALPAADVCVIVISAREGAEAQTEFLLRLAARHAKPLLFFVNKCDMETPHTAAQQLSRLVKGGILPLNHADMRDMTTAERTEEALTALADETLLERYLHGEEIAAPLASALRGGMARGEICPLIYGSARTGAGVSLLLDTLHDYSFPRDPAAPFSAFVYQVEHREGLGKIAHLRLFGGALAVRGAVYNRRTGSTCKAAQIKHVLAMKFLDVPQLTNGDIGAVTGLSDVKAGDFLGDAPPISLELTPPYFRMKVAPIDATELPALKKALEELSDESPSLHAEWVDKKRELTVSAAGKIQAEILKETLRARYGLEATLSAPSVIYRETPVREAYGFASYTMPKPCWAVVRFLIQPLPRGSGLVYESVCSEKKIAYRYQEHIRTEVPRTLTQGLKSWQVTDLKVTLVDGEDHPQHTHPLDFFVATPMGIMDGLKNAGTRLLEPVLHLRVSAPEHTLGKVLALLAPRRAKLNAPEVRNEKFVLEADIPAEETFTLQEEIASATGGRADVDLHLIGYFPCPEGKGAVRERVGIDPLDRSLWILHARGAYKK